MLPSYKIPCCLVTPHRTDSSWLNTCMQMARLTLDPKAVLTARGERPRSLNSLEKECVRDILGLSSATTTHALTRDRSRPRAWRGRGERGKRGRKRGGREGEEKREERGGREERGEEKREERGMRREGKEERGGKEERERGERVLHISTQHFNHYLPHPPSHHTSNPPSHL